MTARTAPSTSRVRFRPFLATATLILAALIAAVNSPSGAYASTSDDSASVQERIDEAMKVRPGGTQISATEVSWEDGAVILTVDDGASSRAIGSCATGAFCAWDGANLTGSKLSFTSCTTHSTSGLSVVRSIANARSSGSVRAKNSSGSVLLTLSAGSSTGSAPLGVKSLTCG